jgi:hypothetical protein
MEQAERRLPIRLVPRKGQQVGLLVFFGIFLGFALFWMAGAAGILDLDEGAIRQRTAEEWIGNLFPLFGLPFAAIGLGGIVVALLKLRRNSPHYHLEISSRGLSIKSLFALRRHDWATLPGFETVRVERRTKSGKSIAHYTVAKQTPAATDTPRRQREILRIRADDYGARNGQEDAEALTAWFNHLRDLAQGGRLGADAEVVVPVGFWATAIAAGALQSAGSGGTAGRLAPVIEQTDKRPDRPQTVVRR